MRVGPATPADVDALADLWVALAADQRRYGSHLRAGPNRAVIRESLARAAVADDLRVAREDGEVLGFVSFSIERGDYETDAVRGTVTNVYVRPDDRGQGVGGGLLDAAETALRAHGADVVAIEAMADNERARRLYRRRGYETHRIEFEKPLDDPPDDAARSDNDTREG